MSNKFVPNFAAFRLYEDGTESGSSPIEAQDTDTTGRSVDANSQVHLRVRIDETGAGSIAGATTDDWTCEYRLNGGGSWVAITGASALVQVDTGSSLTDAGATTNRSTNGISDGGGSFFAGVQEDGNGEITDFQHQADNFTEHVFALLLISSALSDLDALTFRVAMNGSNIAAAVVPSITVSKAGSGFVTASTDVTFAVVSANLDGTGQLLSSADQTFIAFGTSADIRSPTRIWAGTSLFPDILPGPAYGSFSKAVASADGFVTASADIAFAVVSADLTGTGKLESQQPETIIFVTSADPSEIGRASCRERV